MSKIALHTRRPPVGLTALALASMLALAVCPAAAGADTGRPTLTAVSAQKQLSGTLPVVRATVRELDGRARLPVLVHRLNGAQKHGRLVR